MVYEALDPLLTFGLSRRSIVAHSSSLIYGQDYRTQWYDEYIYI